MQHDLTFTTTLDALPMPAREKGASGKGWLRQFRDWSAACIARYRARYHRPAFDDHMARDIGRTRADTPHWMEPHNAARMSAGAFGWNAGAGIRISRMEMR
jgi:hypothetical protein